MTYAVLRTNCFFADAYRLPCERASTTARPSYTTSRLAPLTLSLYFLGISICTCVVQAAAGLYTPVVVKAALWGMPGALVGLVVSLPVARFVRESVFQGILLVMIAFAGSVCIIRAVESFL